MIIATLEQGLIFSIMSLGVYISYKILDFPDLTVDGSFPLGGAITGILLVNNVDPVIAIIISTIGGALAGLITGIVHVKFKVVDLLSGIIVMTGLYSINLRIMGRSNIPLFRTENIFKGNLPKIGIIIMLVIIIKIILDMLLKTKFGFALKALGNNEKLIISLGMDSDKLKIIGLMLANSLVALSGSIYAQYQGFTDIGMGIGSIIVALASIIIGDIVFEKNKLLKGTLGVVLGTIIFKGLMSFALKLGLNPIDLKLITSVLVVGIIGFQKRKLKPNKRKINKTKKIRGDENAEINGNR